MGASLRRTAVEDVEDYSVVATDGGCSHCGGAVHDVEDFSVAAVAGQTLFEFRQRERTVRAAVMVRLQERPGFIRGELQVAQRRVQVEKEELHHRPLEPHPAARDVDEKHLHRLRGLSPVQDVPGVKRLVEEAVPVHFRDLRGDQHAVAPPHRRIAVPPAAGHKVGSVARVFDEPRDDEGVQDPPMVPAGLAERQHLARRDPQPRDRLVVAPFVIRT